MRNTITIFRKEMLDTLRDRRTLIFMLAVPILAIPLLMMGMSKLMISQITKAQAQKPKIVMQGYGNLPQSLQTTFSDTTRFDVVQDDSSSEENMREKVKQGDHDLFVIIPDAFTNAIELESTTDIEVYYDKAEVESGFALDTLQYVLKEYKEDIIEERLASRELSEEFLLPFEVNKVNVADIKKIAGKTLGSILPYMIILMCFMGAMYPAIDLAAGEKERGTLETLLVSPARRGEFVLGKYFVILSTGIIAGLLSLASLVLSLNYMVTSELSDTLSINIDLQTMGIIIITIIPLAGIFAALLLSVSIFAKSFKEAQSYIGVLNMFIIFPAIISFLPGIKMSYKMAMIPVVNITLILKDAISGTVEWNYIAAALIATFVLAAITLFFAKKWFEKESVLFRM